MWYKIAKTGYIDVDKELENQLGYELPFKVEDYLRYLIINSSYKKEIFDVIDFDKLNGYLMYSPLNHFISKFSATDTIEEIMSGNDSGKFGSYDIRTKEVQIIPIWNEFLLEKILDILFHEFAHALDKGLKFSNEQESYKFEILYEKIKKFVNYFKSELIDQNNRIVASDDEIFKLYVDFILIENPPPPGFDRKTADMLFAEDRPSILKYTKFFLSNAYNKDDEEESLKDALFTQYLNSQAESPAQLLSLKRQTDPKRTFEYIKQGYIEKILNDVPDLYERYNVPQSVSQNELFDYLVKTYPKFFNPKLRKAFLEIARDLMINDPDQDYLSPEIYEFVMRLRRKHSRRQMFKILNDNFKAFEELVKSI
jgi:hypothetical protein